MAALRRRYLSTAQRAFEHAMDQNNENIMRALRDHAPLDSLVDLGCDDGERTMLWARAAQARAIHGIEVVPDRAKLAEARGVSVVTGDLAGAFPYDSASFDAVVSNQVIEHLFDTDLFLAEAFRVLKPGGVVVTSTENLASWHNVGALLLGWQPFSLTNVSVKGAIGNPFGLWAGGDGSGAPDPVTWQHRRVFAARGLVALHRAHGFDQVDLLGAGYYPLPGRVGTWNPGHAAFITVAGRRP